MHIIDLEQPEGVVVQFGGQTAINLAERLVETGVNILGTSLEDSTAPKTATNLNNALKNWEFRNRKGKAAFSVMKKLLISANEIGYPVLVRPSYVLRRPGDGNRL